MTAKSKAPKAPAPAAEWLPIDAPQLDPANLRKHSPDQIAKIGASLARFGQQRAILIGPDGVVIAGNGTLRAARDLGWTEIKVERSKLTGAQAIAYAIADNRLAEIGVEWADELAPILKALQAEGDGLLAATGFGEDDLAALLKGLEGTDGDGAGAPEPQVDRAAELREKWGVESGQLWTIPSHATAGKDHRLLCGDSTKAEDVARLMGGEKAQGGFTSPPYAEQRKEQYGGIPADQYVEWWATVQANVRSALTDDGSFFVNIKAHCEDGQRSLYVMDLVLAMVRRWDWRYVDELIWHKQGMPGLYGDRLKNEFEPVHHFSRATCKTRFSHVSRPSDEVPHGSVGSNAAMQGKGDPLRGRGEGLALPGNVIWAPPDSASAGDHAARFPVALPRFFLKAFSDPGDEWLEPFCGSGTTLVASEQTGRFCRGLEIEPGYVAVSLQRLADMGLEPHLA